MAVYKRDIVDINLETGNIHRSFLKHSIGYKDAAADHFGIRVFRNGEPVNLTGVSVQGIFMPPQGDPIAITSGNIVNYNEAEVVLPQACYNYDGQFTLAIKLVDPSNAVTGTMRIVDGMVDNTHASGTVAPTAAVPGYEEVLATYEQAIAAINKTVRFDATQSLTDTQKATARSNISAPSVAEMNTAVGNEATARQNADALKVNISDIENDLTGTNAGKVLDARQGKVLDDKVSDVKSALNASELALIDTENTYSVVNNNYIHTNSLINGETYRIGITVKTAGTYTIRIGTNGSTSAMVDNLFENEPFGANETKYSYYTPNVDGVAWFRNSSATVEWSVSYSEFISSKELKSNDAVIEQDISDIDSTLNDIDKCLFDTPVTVTAADNNYIQITPLKKQQRYRIGITVQTSGTYTVRAGTSASVAGMVYDLFSSVSFEANKEQFAFLTPDIDGIVWLRINSAISWTAKISEFIPTAGLQNDVANIDDCLFDDAEAYTVSNNNYLQIPMLMYHQPYKIGISVGTEGSYTFKIGTGSSIGSMTETLFEDVIFKAGIPQYVYIAPETRNLQWIRCNSANVTWAVSVQEFIANQVEHYVTPEMFGAVGDGQNDDTAALQAAFDTKLPVIAEPGRTYIATSSITLIDVPYVDFNRSFIKAQPHGDSATYWDIRSLMIIDNTATIYSSMANVGLDCSNIAECGLLCRNGKRILYTGFVIKNCISRGACFNEAGGSAVRDMYLEGGTTSTHVNNNNTALDIRSHDMTFDSVDYSRFMRGMHCNKGGFICSKFHGFITGENELANYDESVFVEIEKPGKYSFSDSYPDTQGIHYKINSPGVYLTVFGGYGFTAAGTGDETDTYINGDMIANKGPIYAFYAENKEWLKNVVVSDYLITCLNVLENGKYTCYLSNYTENPEDNLIVVDDSVYFQQDGVLITQNGKNSNKNLLHYDWSSKSQDGITVTNDNGVINISGTCTASEYTDILLCELNAKNGVTYIANGIPGGGASRYQLVSSNNVVFPSGYELICETSNDVVCEAKSSGSAEVYLRIFSGWSSDTPIKLYPMIRTHGSNAFVSGGDGDIYIGNTRITEEQAKALLALLN